MLHFLIAPDFPAADFAGWYFLNTWLQNHVDTTIHLHLPESNSRCQSLMRAQPMDLVYANPFDAAELVRGQGYLPLVRPIGRSDEIIIVAPAEAAYQHSDDLPAGCRIITTDNRDLGMIGRRLLESAALEERQIEWLHADTFEEVARRLLLGEAEAGFFLAAVYRHFCNRTRAGLKILMESRLYDLSHVILLHPDAAAWQTALQQAFVDLAHSEDGRRILADLDTPQGFAPLETEETEFMIDLIETLHD